MSDDEDDVPIPSQTPKRKLDGNTNGGSKKSKGDTQYLHYALDEEDEQQLLLSEGKNWGRPPLRKIDPEKDSIGMHAKCSILIFSFSATRHRLHAR